MKASENIVVFKGKKSGITIILDDSADFSALKDVFIKKLDNAKKFFSGAKSSVSFQGRSLSENEEAELLAILKERSELVISDIKSEPKEKIEQPFTASSMNEESVKRFKSRFFEELGRVENTFYYSGSVRSGQSLRYNGSVVIIGDVNPGAEVIADGSVIILGSAKGSIHAGCGGTQNAFVAAIRLTPIQLRISDVITSIPVNGDSKSMASYAYFKDGKIYVEML